MKFDQKTIITLLIGIVIGGVAMGLIDANRPKPLFSSASVGIPEGTVSITYGGRCLNGMIELGRSGRETYCGWPLGWATGSAKPE